jgi:hypothetical protein
MKQTFDCQRVRGGEPFCDQMFGTDVEVGERVSLHVVLALVFVPAILNMGMGEWLNRQPTRETTRTRS